MTIVIPIITIPRSGTHFTNEIIRQYSLLKNQRFIKFFSSYAGGISESFCQRGLEDIKGEINEYIDDSEYFTFLGHWSYDESLYEFFRQFKPIFVYRNPLDVAVSYLEGAYSLKLVDPVAGLLKLHEHKISAYYKFLRGIPHIDHPWARGFRQIFEDRLAWLDKELLIIRYEDLLLNPDTIAKKLSRYLGLELEGTIIAIKNATHNPDSITLRNGEIGDWKSCMPPEMQEIYIKEIGDIIEELGYEYN